MRATVLVLFLVASALAAKTGRGFSKDVGKNAKHDNVCARIHNNTALVGTSPIDMMQATAYECQKRCVDVFPNCTAVVYYYLHNDTKHHHCYLFEHNSVYENVELVEQKPEHKKDLVKMLELTRRCHEFDAHPPLVEDGLASSTDKVDRKKRQHKDDSELGTGEWTDWSACSENGHETRSQECAYGRKIQRRGCPARQAPQRLPAPSADQYRQQQLLQQQQQEQQRQLQLQQQQRQQQDPRQDPRLQQQQQPLPASYSGEYTSQINLQGRVPPQAQQPQPQQPQQPQQSQQPQQPQRSPYDQYAALYQQRMSQNRENANQRHPAVQQAVPCSGGVCEPVRPQPQPQPQPRPPQPPVLAPVINTAPWPPATQPPQQVPLPTRYRPAPPPPPACDGQGCVSPPLVPGNWHDWSEWSTCSCTCDDGAKSRRRECATNNCQGPEYETEPCNMGPCQTWSDWCEWSTCSASCGSGQRERTRFCHLGTNRCEGKDYESEQCLAGPCPEWSEWEDWGQCSVSCGTGAAIRQRTCLGGLHGDYLCPGPKTEQKLCEAGPCQEWSPWQEWSACSASCGDGMKRRQRICQYGTDCQGPAEESLFCYGPPCAQWTEWCEWSGCSAKCGPGQRTRTRGCLGPDGLESTACQGSSIETIICEGTSCCNWSEWCHWSMCDKECGGGKSLRTRTCMSNGAADSNCLCEGPDREEKECNTQTCTPQCAWTQWCEWSSCSTQLSCEVGIQSRNRQCVGEPGCHCLGLADESQQCRGPNPCPQKPPC
ncbi:unnamed protein product [Caenorhabditis auriculariae]|uniref:Apple domain-containing protein n=1 Tax=Caenorhabditis auriculariae TaxID=2777116 RepID=A0A8S1GNX9_9PELO|nr:unnamed protein product [Caenorhabditis auriculariae]